MSVKPIHIGEWGFRPHSIINGNTFVWMTNQDVPVVAYSDGCSITINRHEGRIFDFKHANSIVILAIRDLEGLKFENVTVEEIPIPNVKIQKWTFHPSQSRASVIHSRWVPTLGKFRVTCDVPNIDCLLDEDDVNSFVHAVSEDLRRQGQIIPSTFRKVGRPEITMENASSEKDRDQEDRETKALLFMQRCFPTG